MSYIEQVLNRRISDLNIDKEYLIQKSKDLIIAKKFDDYDINDFAIDLSDLESRIDELEKLKIGLGLVSVETLKERKEAVNQTEEAV